MRINPNPVPKGREAAIAFPGVVLRNHCDAVVEEQVSETIQRGGKIGLDRRFHPLGRKSG